MNGKIHLILGPMYSGKTEELIRRKKRAEIAGKKCLVIKYYKDTRYDPQMISTHDLVKCSAILSKGNQLRSTFDQIPSLQTYQCLFVDEIQFYEDGAVVCDDLANHGFDVTVCGLQGDYQRKIFKCIADLIPKADEITHLRAIDPETGNEASFTARLTLESEQEVIGGLDKYISVDRQHYQRLHPTRSVSTTPIDNKNSIYPHLKSPVHYINQDTSFDMSSFDDKNLVLIRHCEESN